MFSTPSSSSSSATTATTATTATAVSVDTNGMKVDFEMKALVIATIFAAIKALTPRVPSFLFVNLCRLFFLAGHGALVYIYLLTNFRISKSTSRSPEEKAAAKKGCLDVLKGVLVKAVLLAAVHFKTGMLPPMFVTVFMAWCSFIENDFFYQVMYSKTPALFEILYR